MTKTLEELGFKEENSNGIPYLQSFVKENKHCGKYVNFWENTKSITTYECDYDFMEDSSLFIDMELLEAIVNKCKEKGWIND